jgi:hypothetical protein
VEVGVKNHKIQDIGALRHDEATFLQECYYVQYYLLILYHIYYSINMNLYHYYVTLE